MIFLVDPLETTIDDLHEGRALAAPLHGMLEYDLNNVLEIEATRHVGVENSDVDEGRVQIEQIKIMTYLAQDLVSFLANEIAHFVEMHRPK